MELLQDENKPTLLPEPLRSAFHESYLSQLSEQFSKMSHEGGYEEALEAGETMLSLYNLIYPSNYPQLGTYIP